MFKFTKHYYAFLADDANLDKLLIVVGPVCSGKTSLIKRLITEFSNFFDIPKKTTTRKPGNNEDENKNFYFLAREKFFQMTKNKEFIQSEIKSDEQIGITKDEIQRIQNLGKVMNYS